MIDYGLKDRVAIITGANNPWGIGATTAIAFAREGAKVVLVYKKVDRPFDASKMDRNGVDRYYGANAGNADAVESKLKEMGADYIILESDISNEDAIKEIYCTVLEKYGRVDILFNNAATDDETGCDTIETITQDVIDNTFVLAAPVAALIVSGVADYIDDKQQKQIQAEKERLQKEAISKQAALIQALRDDAQMSRERQDYLECLNQQLQKALEDFQREAVQDEQV